MFQTKEQDKFPETDLNEMEISDVPNERIQYNSHKDCSRRSGEQCMNKMIISVKR